MSVSNNPSDPSEGIFGGYKYLGNNLPGMEHTPNIDPSEETENSPNRPCSRQQPGESSGTQPDLLAQYLHHVAASALEKIKPMVSQVFSAKGILSGVDQSWTEHHASRSLLANSIETYSATQQEIRQSRAQLTADLDSASTFTDFKAPSRKVEDIPHASAYGNNRSGKKWGLLELFTNALTIAPGENPIPPEESVTEPTVQPRIATAQELSDAFNGKYTSASEPTSVAGRLLKDGKVATHETFLTNNINTAPEPRNEALAASDKRILEDTMMEVNLLAAVPRIVGIGIEKVCNRSENLQSACKVVGEAFGSLVKGAQAVVENTLPDAQREGFREGVDRWAALPNAWEEKYGIPEKETRHFKQSCELLAGSAAAYGVGSAIAKVPQAVGKVRTAWKQLPGRLAGEEHLLIALKTEHTIKPGAVSAGSKTEHGASEIGANPHNHAQKTRKIEKILPERLGLSHVPLEYVSDLTLQLLLKRGGQVIRVIDSVTGATTKRAVLPIGHATKQIRQQLLKQKDQVHIINGRYHYDFATHPIPSPNTIVESAGSKTKQVADEILRKPTTTKQVALSPGRAAKIEKMTPEHLGLSSDPFRKKYGGRPSPYRLSGEILLKNDTLIFKINGIAVPHGTLDLPSALLHMQHLAQKHGAKWVELVILQEEANLFLSTSIGSPISYRNGWKFRFPVQATPIEASGLTIKPLSLPETIKPQVSRWPLSNTLFNIKEERLQLYVMKSLHPKHIGVPYSQVEKFTIQIRKLKNDLLKVDVVRLVVKKKGTLNFFRLKSELESIARLNGASTMRVILFKEDVTDRMRRLILKRGGQEIDGRRSDYYFFDFSIHPISPQNVGSKTQQVADVLVHKPSTPEKVKPSIGPNPHNPAQTGTKIGKILPEHLGLSPNLFMTYKFESKFKPYRLNGDVLLINDTLILRIEDLAVPKGTLNIPRALLGVHHLAQKHGAKWIELVAPLPEKASRILSKKFGPPTRLQYLSKFKFPVQTSPIDASKFTLKSLPLPDFLFNPKKDRLKLYGIRALYSEDMQGIPLREVQNFNVRMQMLYNIFKVEVMRLEVNKKGTLNFSRLKSELESIARLNGASTMRVILQKKHVTDRIRRIILKRGGQEFEGRSSNDSNFDFAILPKK